MGLNDFNEESVSIPKHDADGRCGVHFIEVMNDEEVLCKTELVLRWLLLSKYADKSL